MVAYAFSLLTNRQLIISLNNPCNFNQLFKPNKVNWLLSDYNLTGKTGTNISCSGSKVGVCVKEIPNIKNIESDVIYMNPSDQKLMDHYIANEINLKNEILSLGLVNRTEDFVLKNLFHKWYHDLFKLEHSLEEKYNLIKQKAYLDENTQIYCAQIRIGGKRPNVGSDSQFNHRNISKTFWKFIRENFIQNSSNHNWKLFVTSDLESVELEAVDEFGEEKVIRILGTSSHVGREKNLANNCSRIEKPILDFHFLQNCDKAVISQSSFGRLGTYNRKPPEKDLFYLGYSWPEFLKIKKSKTT